MSLGKKLDEVEIAISKVLQREEYTIDGRHYKSTNLQELRKYHKDLVSKIAIYGRDYVEGQDSVAISDVSYVSFV